MEKLNFTLEVVNGNVSILSFFLLYFLTVYLIYDIQREGFSVKNFLLMSTAASLVVSLFVENAGKMMTRTVVWGWRTRGGAVPFTVVENFFLIGGAILTALGSIMLIRVLSRPRFGDWPWVASAAVALSFTALELINHLMR